MSAIRKLAPSRFALARSAPEISHSTHSFVPFSFLRSAGSNTDALLANMVSVTIKNMVSFISAILKLFSNHCK